MWSVQVNHLTYAEYDFKSYHRGINIFTPFGRDNEIQNIMRSIRNATHRS